jgi:uncharacterized repeat protein (TIGR03803 family)
VTATYTIDHVFTGNPDGENPRHDAMTLLNGRLFGTTLQGGTKNTGIIFSVAQTSSSYAVLTSLHKSTGDESHSCFVVVNNMGNNLLYGMTESGGDNDGGVIFSFDPSTLNYQPAYSFAKPTGHEPHGRLTLDPNGTTLYGMTRKGGSSGYGVVFSFDITTSNYQVLHDFSGGPTDGATTDHGYVVQSGNCLYGMTTYGGPNLRLTDKHSPRFTYSGRPVTTANSPTGRFSWSAINSTVRPRKAAITTWARYS